MAIWNLAGRFLGICGVASLLLGGAVPASEAKTVVIKRSTIYVTTLPRGCVKTTYSGGVVVWKCGKVYYQPYQGRYVRVYIG